MASTSDVASTSSATSLSSSINSPPPTFQDIPKINTAERDSDVYKLRHYSPLLGFMCKTCGYCCFTDEQWEYHNYHSHGQLQYRCTEQSCDFTYSYECEQFLHVMKVHKPGSYYCAICVIPLSTKVDYKHHALTDHSVYYIHYFGSRPDMISDPHLDFNLDLESGDNQQYLLPSRVRLRDPVYRCFTCAPPDLSMSLLSFKEAEQNTTSCSFKELLKHHKEKHSPAYPCPVCPEVYSTIEVLTFHTKLHYIMILEYYCHTCNIGFTSRKKFETHSFKVHNKRLYTCELCGTSFKYLNHLNAHNKSIHGEAH